MLLEKKLRANRSKVTLFTNYRLKIRGRLVKAWVMRTIGWEVFKVTCFYGSQCWLALIVLWQANQACILLKVLNTWVPNTFMIQKISLNTLADVGTKDSQCPIRQLTRAVIFSLHACTDYSTKHISSTCICTGASTVCTFNNYYYHFVGHCGAFCGLKWRIWRAKIYFSPLK